MLGLIIGSFTYCLVVLRAVRIPVDSKDSDNIRQCCHSSWDCVGFGFGCLYWSFGPLHWHFRDFTHDDIVMLAYNEVPGTSMRCINTHSQQKFIVESLRLIRESLVTLGFKDRAPEIERQVQHIEAGVHNVSSHISTDHDFISEARSGRFLTWNTLAIDLKRNSRCRCKSLSPP